MHGDGTGAGSNTGSRGALGSALRGAAVLAAVAAVAAAALLSVLRPLSLAMPGSGLDPSWIAVLGEAAVRHARWGVDLAFTYGPASALVTRYFTDGYLASALPFLVGVALVDALALVCLARAAAAGRRFGGAWIAVAVAAEVAALAAELALDQDSFYFALALALLLLDLVRRPGQRLPLAAVLLGAALLGAAGLAKTSYGVVALGIFAVADARRLLELRRPPVLVPVALAAALAAFLACGQRPGDLPAYLDLQGQVTAGYGEAMYLPPGRWELGLFLCCAAGLIAVAGIAGTPGRWGRVAAALGTAFVLALSVKAGFVRADTHTQIAWSLLGLAGVAVAVGLVLPRSAGGAALLGACSLAVLWVVGPLFFLAATERAPRLAALPEVYRDMGAVLRAERGAWAGFLRDPSAFAAAARAAKAAAWAGIRDAQPLPPLAGGVDMLPSDQSALLANGLDYRPRPSFQDYSTYSAGLIGANAAFYAGPRAPDWVIFDAGALDDRHPNTTEGALWPDLLRRYEPQRRVGPGIALRRRTLPLPDVLGDAIPRDAKLGARVAVPVPGPVFARVTVQKTLLGRLASALFRPPALSLQLTLAGGGERMYRFVPAIAAAGFLLSPLVEDADGFADLAFGHGAEAGAGEVTALTVGGSPWTRFFYDPDVEIAFYPVAVAAAPPSAEAAPLAVELAHAQAWRKLARAIDAGAPMDGDRLSVPAPTALTVPVAGARRLRVAFGIADGAWTDGKTQGVCFALRASPGAAPLWRRCLEPRTVAADRGPQSAEVALPPGLATVTAETDCVADCSWGWSYWSDIASAD